MKLKMKYQYTYFIHPYLVDKSRYDKYMLKLLKDKKCEFKIFEKEKDMGIYAYFLPHFRDYLFPTFEFRGEKLKNFQNANVNLKSKMLAKQSCSCFTYKIDKQLKGKLDDKENGIFFNIEKIEIICFNTGICFLTFKTNLDGTDNFYDLLDFNYKFRDINSEFNSLKDFDKIRIQTDTFQDVKNITELISEITGVYKRKFTGISGEFTNSRFYTYSYVCLDSENWNERNNLDDYPSDFYRFANVLPSSYLSDFNKDKLSENLVTIDKYKYYKIPITKQSSNLICSGVDTYNFTELLIQYENEYFYTYIIALYQKIFLMKLNDDFKEYEKIVKMKSEFVTFTNQIWENEITLNDNGTQYYKTLKQVLEIEDLYNEVKNKYEIAYKDLNIEKNGATFTVLIILLICSFALNLLNIVMIISLL